VGQSVKVQNRSKRDSARDGGLVRKEVDCMISNKEAAGLMWKELDNAPNPYDDHEWKEWMLRFFEKWIGKARAYGRNEESKCAHSVSLNEWGYDIEDDMVEWFCSDCHMIIGSTKGLSNSILGKQIKDLLSRQPEEV